MLAGKPRRIARLAVMVGGVAVGMGLMVGSHLLRLLFTDNFHAVVSGEIYRSAQPDPAEIVRYAKAYGIRTIINLRGENVGKGWYDAEVAEARRLDIDHIDFRMSARRTLSQAQAAELIGILESAKRPILLHCTNGADRSGLAAALYVAAVGKLGEAAAESQMSIRYGHISLPILDGYAMDETWEALEPWLGFPDS